MTNGENVSLDSTLHGKQLFQDGRREFLAGQYFEAHDIWEEFWHTLHGPDRRYLQGLIHLAVGAYHYGNRNTAGARSQWKKAVLKLGEYPACHWGTDVSVWVQWIGVYLEGNPAGPLPVEMPFQPDRFPSHLPMAS